MARQTAKSPEAFRTISEAADALDLPQHVLRFWETRFSQIKPMKRSGGRRYYRPNDITLLRGIKHLLYDEGYTIKGVQRILREQGIAHVIDLVGNPSPASPTQTPSAAQASNPAQAPSPVQAPIEGASPAEAVGSAPSADDPVLAAFSSPPTVDAPREPAPLPVQNTASALPPSGPTLRFVPDQPPDHVPPEYAPPVQASPPSLPRAPVPPPQPIQPGAGAVPSAGLVNPQPLPDTASPSYAVPAPEQLSAIPAGSPPASVALSSQQRDVLTKALQTLMDCKSQLDQARPQPIQT